MGPWTSRRPCWLDFYAQREFEVVLGMSLFCVATGFLAGYSVQLTLWRWRMEGRTPLMANGHAWYMRKDIRRRWRQPTRSSASATRSS